MDAAADFKRFEAEGWGRRAAGYGLLTGAISGRAAEALLDATRAGPGVRLLDVASGQGEIVSVAAARGAAAVGVDLSEGMVEFARSRYPALRFCRGDAEDLPFGDGEFQALTAAFVLNHLPTPGRATAEAVRVLEPGGRAAFAVWDRPERNPFMGLVRGAIEDAGLASEEAVPSGGPDPFRYADDAEFRALLEGTGFAGVEVRKLEVVHRAGSADELWEGVLAGTVRASALVLSQPQPVRTRIRAALERRAEDLRDGDAIALPAVIKLAAGERR
jgi:ubiquinone/menaquinone biosynthesis C-methylase UbiE